MNIRGRKRGGVVFGLIVVALEAVRGGGGAGGSLACLRVIDHATGASTQCG